MKRLIIFLLCVAHAFSLYAGQSEKTYRVAITQIVQHPSLDKIRQGVLDELRESGFIEGKNCEIIYDNAQGNMTLAAQIAQKFGALAPNAIVAITTPSAQTVAQAIKHTGIPLVFGAVSDPVGAGLMEALDKKPTYITGTIDLPSAQAQLKEIYRLLPSLQKLAILFNPSEVNSLKQIQNIKEAAQDYPVQIIEIPAMKTSDVSGAAQQAINQADAIFVPNDNTIVSALEAVVQVADSRKVPIFTSDPESVERGALAATANDQYAVGRATGKLVVKILQGAKTTALPIQLVTQTQTYVNPKKAALFGIKYP